jgi:hypothetical protein
MVMNVALTTLKGTGWNGLYAAGHLAGGFVVAVTINKLAHYILKPQPKSELSLNIGNLAVFLGMTASLCFASQAALVALTAKQALAVISLGIAASAIVHWIDYDILHLICLGAYIAIAGAAAGCLGAPVLPLVGIMGACEGGMLDIIDPEKMREAMGFPPKKKT